MWAETRLRPTDPWQAYRPDEMEGTPRNYYMFGLIAGVRHWDAQLYNPRGFPKDLSQGLSHVPEEMDHTPTWLTLPELKRCVIAFNREALREGDTHENLWLKLKDPGTGLNPYIWDYSNGLEPTYNDVVAYFEQWVAVEKMEAQLLNTDAKPEVRFIIFFDS